MSSPQLDWSKAEEVLRTWLRRARESQLGHYKAATFYQRLDRWLGVPALALSAAVGAWVLASSQTSGGMKVVLGLMSILAAVLMTLHTSLAFADRSERHKLSGARYAGVRREIEELLALPSGVRKNMAEALDDVRRKMDRLAEESPALPAKYWNEGKSYEPPAFLK